MEQDRRQCASQPPAARAPRASQLPKTITLVFRVDRVALSVRASRPCDRDASPAAFPFGASVSPHRGVGRRRSLGDVIVMGHKGAGRSW